MSSDSNLTSSGHSEDISAELRKLLMSGMALGLAGANVIMQLSRLPIGRGVAESKVESGALFKHPVKRTRTTLGYVMIALFGTERERDQMRTEVNRQHRFVRSGDDSDMEYNAYDPELQLWVAACMYRGIEDAAGVLYGVTNPETLDAIYRHCSRFATTLQVSESRWPRDRSAFEIYWSDSLQHIAMDDVTRDYLLGLASLRFLPFPLRVLIGPFHELITAGFLPDPFRSELGLKWNPQRQQLFRLVTAAMATCNRLMPKRLREFPWNVALWDTRRRIRDSRRVV